MAPCKLDNVQGVLVKELDDGVDFSGMRRKLKFDRPDMQEVCVNPGMVDRVGLPLLSRRSVTNLQGRTTLLEVSYLFLGRIQNRG